MENSFRSEKDVFSLQLSDRGKSNLLEVSRWGKFLGYVAIIYILLVVGFFAYIMSRISAMAASYGNTGQLKTVILWYWIMLIVGVLLTVYPIYSLIRFERLIKPALYTSDQDRLDTAFAQLGSLFKYLGILTLIFLLLFVAGSAFGLMGAAMI
ncbi:MAG: hypothetical protein JNL72_06135 [Flavipsychrobacter sp.]|nr:hypothetical protein [Flavipsychrobacter sp.]